MLCRVPATRAAADAHHQHTCLFHMSPADALAKNFASQCGFCTPGITVAVAAAAAAGAGVQGQGCGVKGMQGDSTSAVSVAHGLDGNLCRCTGWRPIIDACRVRRCQLLCWVSESRLFVRHTCVQECVCVSDWVEGSQANHTHN